MALSTERGLPAGGFLGAVHAMRGYLSSADLTVGNLEGTLSVGGASKCGAGAGGGTCFAFQAPPTYAEQLHTAGFDLVNQANNHSMDYGESGRAQTLAALGRAGVAQTGLPGEITSMKVQESHVAFVGFAPYAFDANLLDIPAAQALIRRARRTARVVVVLIHAGAEGADRDHTPYGDEYFLGEDRGNPRAFAHAAIDAGASLVLGSGPHVIRGVERYRGHPIAYSLGNFVGLPHAGGRGPALRERDLPGRRCRTEGGLLARPLDLGRSRRRPATSRARQRGRSTGGPALPRRTFPRGTSTSPPTGASGCNDQDGPAQPKPTSSSS